MLADPYPTEFPLNRNRPRLGLLEGRNLNERSPLKGDIGRRTDLAYLEFRNGVRSETAVAVIQGPHEHLDRQV